MSSLSPDELRWLIGKLARIGIDSSNRSDWAQELKALNIPAALRSLLDDPETPTITPLDSIVILTAAADRLYANSPEDLARVSSLAQALVARVWLLPDQPSSAELDANATQLDGSGGDPATSRAASTDDQTTPVPTPIAPAPRPDTLGSQTVSAGRDVNAPIVNAPGGNVYVGVPQIRPEDQLHDYPTFVLYLTMGVAQLHATDHVRPYLDAAMASLANFHENSRHEIGRNVTNWSLEEIARNARDTIGRLDAACQALLGSSYENSRPVPLEPYALPTFGLFADMRLIRGGYDPYTGRTVNPYYLQRHPVTVGQFLEFCNITHGSRPSGWNDLEPPMHTWNRPVTGVNLFDMLAYCLWLEGATGFRFRLPTESEWCYAATSGARQKYPGETAT